MSTFAAPPADPAAAPLAALPPIHRHSWRQSATVQDALWGAAFIAPFLLVAAVFLVGPVGYSLYLSFFESHLYNQWSNYFADMKFVGWGNYADLLRSRDFWWGLTATFIYAAITIPLGIAASLGLALALHQRLPGHKFFRGAFFLPHVFDVFVVAVIWLLLYNTSVGPLADVAAALGVPWFKTKGFIDNPITILPSIGIAMVLKGMGFGMILFITALNNISESIFEAADIDGCTPWQKLWTVTIPMLRPMIFFQSVTGLVGVLNGFTEFFAMTNGSGGVSFKWMGGTVQAGRVAGYHLYDQFNSGLYGHAAAMSFLLLVVALLITAGQHLVLRERA